MNTRQQRDTTSHKPSDKPSDDTSAKGGKSFGFPGFSGSSQQLWQAGLGAFARAQAEGSKAFESLVKEGAQIQQRANVAAGERLSEATQRVSSMAAEIGSKATGQWNKLEGIFEERVAKALSRMGVPTASLVKELAQRVDMLNAEVEALRRQTGAAAAPAKSPRGASGAAPKTRAKTAASATKPAAARKRASASTKA